MSSIKTRGGSLPLLGKQARHKKKKGQERRQRWSYKRTSPRKSRVQKITGETNRASRLRNEKQKCGNSPSRGGQTRLGKGSGPLEGRDAGEARRTSGRRVTWAGGDEDYQKYGQAGRHPEKKPLGKETTRRGRGRTAEQQHNQRAKKRTPDPGNGKKTPVAKNETTKDKKEKMTADSRETSLKKKTREKSMDGPRIGGGRGQGNPLQHYDTASAGKN